MSKLDKLLTVIANSCCCIRMHNLAQALKLQSCFTKLAYIECRSSRSSVWLHTHQPQVLSCLHAHQQQASAHGKCSMSWLQPARWQFLRQRWCTLPNGPAGRNCSSRCFAAVAPCVDKHACWASLKELKLHESQLTCCMREVSALSASRNARSVSSRACCSCCWTLRIWNCPSSRTCPCTRCWA